MKAVNIAAELAKHDEGSFLNILPFNNYHLSAVSITGVSPVWEMHPDTDELFFVLEGALEIELLTDQSSEHQFANPGAPDGAKFIYLTPGRPLHSNKADPRV